jgi:hypothetical protein
VRHAQLDVTSAALLVRLRLGLAVAQAGSRLIPTAATRVRAQARSCGICGGHSGYVAGSLQVIRFHLPSVLHPTSPSGAGAIGYFMASVILDWASLHPKKQKKQNKLALPFPQNISYCGSIPTRSAVSNYIEAVLYIVPLTRKPVGESNHQNSTKPDSCCEPTVTHPCLWYFEHFCCMPSRKGFSASFIYSAFQIATLQRRETGLWLGASVQKIKRY